jgi:ISXO2-like transposase domain
MNLLDFIQNFPDEESCIAHFKAQRDQIGVVCPKYGNAKHIWLKNKLRYECTHCHCRQSIRSGTVLEFSKLPFRYRYVAMHLLTGTKKSFSASELQRQLGHKRYQPIWEMHKKLSGIMGKRDNEYQLSGQIELDNAFITTLISDDCKHEDLKCGAGSQNKSKVLVMIESIVVKNPKQGKKPKKINHIKMQVVPDLKADTAVEIVKEQIDSKAELTTDDSKTFYRLHQAVEVHKAQVIEPEDLQKILPWVHISIANVKRLLLDIHHQLKKEYLQYYLNEYCYKFNRRYFGEKMFDRLVFAAANYNTDFKSRIYNRSLCG